MYIFKVSYIDSLQKNLPSLTSETNFEVLCIDCLPKKLAKSDFGICLLSIMYRLSSKKLAKSDLPSDAVRKFEV